MAVDRGIVATRNGYARQAGVRLFFLVRGATPREARRRRIRCRSKSRLTIAKKTGATKSAAIVRTRKIVLKSRAALFSFGALHLSLARSKKNKKKKTKKKRRFARLKKRDFFLFDRDLSFIKYHTMTQRAGSMTTANAKIACDSSNSCYEFKIEAVNQNIE